jgi:hypothetical protein
MRSTQAGVGGKWSVSGPVTSLGSGSYKLRSPILLAMKKSDPKTKLVPRRTLLIHMNTIDLT